MNRLTIVLIIGLSLILESTSLQAFWEKTNGPFFESRTYALAVGISGNDTVVYTGSNEGAIYSTKDKGKTWVRLGGKEYTGVPKDTGITRSPIIVLATAPNGSGGMCLFAVDARGGLFRSLKADTDWVKLNAALDNHAVSALLIEDSVCYTGTEDGLYCSKDHGETWTIGNNNLKNIAIVSLGILSSGEGKKDLLAETPIGLFRSADQSATWTSVNASAKDYHDFANGKTKDGKACLYAISGSAVVGSRDEGATWENLNGNLFIRPNCLLALDTVLFVGTYYEGVRVSWDGGATWGSKPYGDPNGAYALLLVGSELFAAFECHIGSTTSVWYRQYSELLTAVHQAAETLPAAFALGQNYPNPFNPSTTISYSIPKAAWVTITVYDILGQPVACLVNESKPGGRHQVAFDAGDMASGVYLYTVQAGTYTASKKMLLLR